MKTILSILICSVFLATSCSTPMTLDEAQSAHYAVAIGQTKQEVIAMLGKPMRTDKNGRTYWRESNGPDNSVELQVDFDSSGKVSKVAHSSRSYSRGLENTRDSFDDAKK